MKTCGTDVNLNNAVINLDHGDPTMFESYWRKVSDVATITFNGFESLSYFSGNNKSLCWFLEPKLEEEIKRLHKVVGNAVVDDRYIVVGTGSSQLILATLFAVSPSDQPDPVSVVSAAPYYSSYPAMADMLRSELFKWGGDACAFQQDGRPYIELITSPNNPDGFIRQPAVASNVACQGSLIHDLAYYWPHYTPITSPADHDIMLFTASKCTGHAGSRIGWAIVRDKEVAKKMVKFTELFTIGVSKEAQLRAAKILGVVSESCGFNNVIEIENFFEHNRRRMSERWKALRRVVDAGNLFSLPEYPFRYCCFTKNFTQTMPAFAWMKIKGREEDCEKVLREKKILSRSGKRFGADSKCVRISMVSKDEEFIVFLERLMALQQEATNNMTANGNY